MRDDCSVGHTKLPGLLGAGVALKAGPVQDACAAWRLHEQLQALPIHFFYRRSIKFIRIGLTRRGSGRRGCVDPPPFLAKPFAYVKARG